MTDLYNIGVFFIDQFVLLWDLVTNNMGWIGACIIGFIVFRLLFSVISKLGSGARSE